MAWNNSITITIDSTAVLTDFPVLVKLSSSSGISGADVTDVFDVLGDSSKKIKVEDSTGQLYVEIERWDSTSQLAFLWVKTSLVVGSNPLIIYYDADEADNTAYVGDIGDSAAQNVWDDDFVGVYHLAQAPAGAGTLKDSTSLGNWF